MRDRTILRCAPIILLLWLLGAAGCSVYAVGEHKTLYHQLRLAAGDPVAVVVHTPDAVTLSRFYDTTVQMRQVSVDYPVDLKRLEKPMAQDIAKALTGAVPGIKIVSASGAGSMIKTLKDDPRRRAQQGYALIEPELPRPEVKRRAPSSKEAATEEKPPKNDWSPTWWVFEATRPFGSQPVHFYHALNVKKAREKIGVDYLLIITIDSIHGTDRQGAVGCTIHYRARLVSLEKGELPAWSVYLDDSRAPDSLTGDFLKGLTDPAALYANDALVLRNGLARAAKGYGEILTGQMGFLPSASNESTSTLGQSELSPR